MFTFDSFHSICPDGFEQLTSDPDGNCYHYSVEKRSWDEAAEYAATFNGFLASIPDQETNDRLHSLVMNTKGTCSYLYRSDFD